MANNKPIIIFGGTFDPIHLGHLHAAIELYQQLSVQKIRMIPSNEPKHKNPPVANAQHRLNMVKLAIENYPELTLDDCEIRRGGPTYTIDTLEELKPTMPTTPLCITMGIDTFNDFLSWKRWQNILTLAHLVITTRSPHQLTTNPEIQKLIQQRQIENPEELSTSQSGKIFLQDIIPLPISATEIRAKLKAGKTLENELPPKVWQYILQHGLYGIED